MPRFRRGSLPALLIGLAVVTLLAPVASAADELTILPGAAEIVGQNGARFSSTLVLANVGPDPAHVTVGLIPLSGGTPSPASLTIAPGETRRIPEALKTLFSLESGAGALRLTSDRTVISSLQTVNLADPSGTFGLSLLPVPEADFLSSGQTGHAVWVSQSANGSAGSRTNVSLTLVDPNTSVTVRVLDETGAVRGTTTVSSATPMSWQARVQDFVSGALDLGRVEFSVGAGRATGYTVVNDNVTSDAIAMQAERVVPGATDKLLSGSAKAAGLFASFWATGVRLFNSSDAAVDVTIDAIGFGAAKPPVVRTIAAHGLVELSPVLDLFGLPDGSAGALRFRAPAPVLIGARTANVDPAGVRLGVFSAQQFISDYRFGLLPSGGVGSFTGVGQTDAIPGTRSNLTLFGGPEGATGSLVLHDANGTETNRVPFTAAPGQWQQKGVADWFPPPTARDGGARTLAFPTDARIDVEVTGGSLDGYVSRIDNGSGDAITTPLSAGCGVPPFSIDSFSVAPPSPSLGQPATLSWSYSISNVSSQSILESEKGLINLQNQVRSSVQTFNTPGLHVALLVARKGCRVESRLLFYTVGCANAPTVTTTTLPAGTVGSSYGPATLAASGGAAPYTWTATGLPAGLSLSSAGVLSGTPTTAGTFPVAFKVTDSAGCTGEKTIDVSICTVLSLSSLPDGRVGTSYNRTITVTGGTAPFTFAKTSGSLPPGLSLSSAGVLSGTPSAAGTFNFTVQATDALGCTGSRSYSIQICPVIAVAPPTLAPGTTGVSYAATLTGTGGSAPYTFASSGALPPGLTLTTAGVLSGTPTVAGTYNFSVTATDSNGCTGTTSYSLQIVCPAGLAFTPAAGALPAATAAQAYGPVNFVGSGGTAPYTFALVSGALPAGLGFAGGVLSGTPTVTGPFAFSIRVTDANNCQVTQAYTLQVNCPTITLSPGSPLPGGTAGTAYSQTITASGGVGTYTFAVTAGALPAGIALSTGGALTGTPTVTGPFTFTVTATDANGCTGSQAYSLTIACPTISITPTTLAAGTAGVAYGPVNFSQTGGLGAITWSLFAGTLPTGVTLTSAGVLSGTPTVTGTFPITVRATDANGCTGDQALTLTINCPTISITPTTLANGTAGVAYGPVNFSQTGGLGAITWSIFAGALPAGVTLTPAGVLSGTPTVTGTFNVTVRATDANGCTGDQALSLTIVCPTITVLPATLPNGVEGTAYPTTTFTQTGGVGTVTWSTNVALPTGLSLAVGTGVLSGTPQPGSAGSYTVTFIATDQNGCTGNVTITFRICPVITLTPPTFDFRVGQAVSTSVVAAGGSGTYTYAVTAGTLPNGLSLAANGTLTGTPTTAGPYSFTVTATDSVTNCTGSIVYSGQVCPVITLPGSLPNGQVAVAYSQSVAASGGTSPYTYVVTTGALPAGLSLDLNTGAITGTPTTQETANFTVTATDANGCTGQQAYSVTIICPVITLSPGSPLTGGTTGASYSQTITASGGTGPYTFAVTSGAVPAGLTLAPGGGLSGTPTALGTFNFTVTATDANGCTGSQAYALTITCATITVSGSPGGGTTGVAYGPVTFTATGGVAPRTFSVTSGAVPTGLTLSTGGVLSGTPTAAGTFNFTITATDSSTGTGSPCTGSQAFSITIVCPAITVNPATLSNGVVGTPYAGGPITATGGSAPYTFAVTAGALPNGVTLNSDGTFSGTPTTAGLFNFTITATDANNCTGSRAYTNVRICPNITLAAAATCATQGTAYSSSVAASPAGTYTYAVTSGALPTSVSLDVNTGALTGTPTAAGSFTFTVTATETASGCTGSQSYTVNVLHMTPAAGALTAGTYGVAYTQTFTATGGIGGFTYAVSAGTVPGGLTLTGGTLSGTPTGATGTGNFSFTITATNTATGCTVSKAYTLLVRPNAQPETYNDVGNTQLAVVAACPSAVTTPNVCVVGTVLSNDSGPGPLTATTGGTTTNGGTVSMNADGTFVFTPIVGSTAADSFTYTLTDNNGITNTAVVTINLSNVVWYVNGAAGVDGDGRSNTPFNTMTSASTAHLSGHFVFVHSAGTPTSTPGSITMKATTTLWGQGTSLPAIGGITIQGTAATSKPVLSGTVTIGGSTVQISSLDVTTSAGTALSDNQAGAITGILVQNGVALSATNNPALVLSDVTGTLGFASVGSSSSAATGVSLTNVAGSFTAPAGTLSNATGTDFFVSGGDASIAFGGTISDASGTVLTVQNATGGTKDFTGAISSGSVSMTGNSASTTVSIRGGLQLSTGTSNAFTATGAGTLEVCDENPCNPAATGALLNTLTTTTGTALNVTGVSISANNLEFRSISANGGANGIFLQNTGTAGGLKVKGDGTNTAKGGNGTGGTIQNMVGADGATAGNGIYLDNTQHVSLLRMQLNGFQNSAIRGFNVVDFRFQYSTINGTSGSSSVPEEGAMAFGSISGPNGLNGGSNVIDNCVIRGAVEHNTEFYNYQAGPNYSLTISNCDITANSAAFGADGVQIELSGAYTSTATVVVQNCFFDDNKSQGVQASALSNSNLDITIDGNTLVRTTQGNEGFIVSNGGSADATVHMTNNNVSGVGGVGLYVGQVAGNATTTSNLTAVISGNTVTHGPTATNSAIIAFLTSTVGQVAPANILIAGNIVTQNSTSGVARGIFVDTPDTSTTPQFTATIVSNTVSVGDGVAGLSGIAAQARRGSGCFDIRSNVVTYPSGTPAGIFGIRLRQVAPATANLEQGTALISDPASTVLQTNNAGATTEVLGTVTVVNNSFCAPPPV